jgi:mannose-1-phosphate guanylyltransferase
MAGGSGTRFWPASRAARPKQFLPISGGAPMIAETWDRLDGLVPPERILIVTAESQADLVREALPDLAPENLLAEPAARNTAPCVALAAHELARRDPDSVMVVLPADHVIQPAEDFRASLAAGAVEAAESGTLVTFGVRPDHPATGYGYIEAGEELRRVAEHPVHRVARFVEKPDLERAKEFLASGRFLWNAGIFVWTTRAFREAVRTHAPDLAAGCERIEGGAALGDVYGTLPAEPVDVAILERADNVRTIPLEYSWKDVGTWAALPDLSEPNDGTNWSALTDGARLVAEDADGCVAYAEGDELIALVGVKDLVVVRAGNATLVCPRERAQDVKRIVARLEEEGRRFL